VADSDPNARPVLSQTERAEKLRWIETRLGEQNLGANRRKRLQRARAALLELPKAPEPAREPSSIVPQLDDEAAELERQANALEQAIRSEPNSWRAGVYFLGGFFGLVVGVFGILDEGLTLFNGIATIVGGWLAWLSHQHSRYVETLKERERESRLELNRRRMQRFLPPTGVRKSRD